MIVTTVALSTNNYTHIGAIHKVFMLKHSNVELPGCDD